MEPLDVAATDWIKDYDPLFELFDEEMQTGAAEAALAATTGYGYHHHLHHHHHQNHNQLNHQHINNTWSNTVPCDAYLTPISDYYYTAASFAATSAPAQQQLTHQQQHQQAYHATMPAPRLMATAMAPTTTAAPTTPTATTTSHQAFLSADGFDLSQYIFSNQQYHNQATTLIPASQLYANTETSATQTVAPCSDVAYAELHHHHHHQQQQEQQQHLEQQQQHHGQQLPLQQQQQPQQTQIQQQQQAADELSLFLGLDWLPSLENELTASEASSTISSSAPVTPILTQIQSESTSSSSSSSSAYSSLAPSPSATLSPCDNGSATTNTSKSNSKKRKPIRSKGTSLLVQPSPKTMAAGATSGHCELSSLELTSRLCVRIEHDYAMVAAT